MINVSADDILSPRKRAVADAIAFLVTPEPSGVHILQRARDKELLAKIDDATAMIARHADSGSLYLSPERFTMTGGFLPNRSIMHLLRLSRRLSNIRSEMVAAGVYTLLTKGLSQRSVDNYSTRMDRVVASLLAASDISSFGALDPTDVLAWLNFHYDRDRNTLANKALWGSGADFTAKCIRTLAGVVGDKFEHFEIRQLTLIRRTDQPGYKHRSTMSAPPEPFIQWVEIWKTWRETVSPTNDGGWQGLKLLTGYLTALVARHFDVSKPDEFLTSARPFSLLEYLIQCAEGGQAIRSLINGASLLAKFSEFLVDHLSLNSRIIAYHPLFTRSDERHIKGLQDDSVRLAPLGKVAANPMPPRLGNVYRQMLLDGPNGWPATHHLCQHPDGSYNPTMPTLFILADEIAARVGQVVRLDSGEGDLETFDAYKMEWVENTGPCAGYWKRETPREPNKGYARRSDDAQIVGIFLNTNKTSAPHLVPWENVFAHTLLYELFLYQREHSPISAPVTPAQYLIAVERADSKKITTYPTIFPLFRMPPVKRKTTSTPVNMTMRNRFWRDSNEALQEIWNATHDLDEQIDIVRYNEFGQVAKTTYTAHGLRSSGITRLQEGGADIAIVSELVAGHANWWMTAKYWKPGSRSISERLDAASRESTDPTAQQALIDLKKGGADAASRLLVPSCQTALFHALPENGGDFLQWLHRDHGICTTDGQGCKNGGSLLRSGKRKNDTDQSLYQYVRGGDGNCFLCRFHLTGPKWADGVEAYGNLCLERIAQKSRQINQMQAQLDDVEAELKLVEPNTKGRLALRQKASRLEAAISDLVNQQAILSDTVVAVKQKLEEILEVERAQTTQGLDPKSALIANKDNDVVGWVKTSRFEHFAMLAAYGQLYVSMYDREVDETVKKVIDEVVFRSGYEPISLRRCSPERRKEMYDRGLELILRCADNFDMNRLDNEAVSLDDLGIPSTETATIFGSKVDLHPISFSEHR